MAHLSIFCFGLGAPLLFLTKKKHMKKNEILKFIIGILLTPILLAIFFIDRQILVILPHLQLLTIRKWFDNVDNIMQSFLRIIAVVSMVILVKLTLMLF